MSKEYSLMMQVSLILLQINMLLIAIELSPNGLATSGMHYHSKKFIAFPK